MSEAATTDPLSDTPWRLHRHWSDGLRLVTAGLRTLPDFLVIGTQKGGTTSLYEWLSQHPDVAPASNKEVHFFDLQHDRGERWYRSRFPRRAALAEGQITGEASPYYLFHPAAAARARALVPRARLVALLRSPVDRAFSHYQHEVRGGRESVDFEAAIERERRAYPDVVAAMREHPEAYSPYHHRHCYLHRGLYAEQLARWLACYPREQLLVLQSEDLFRDAAGTLSRVLEFLGLRDWRPASFPEMNQGRYGDALSPELHSELQRFFAGPNARLAEINFRPHDWD